VGSDAAGNIYSTGVFTGTADLDPGPDTLEVTAAGPCDAYVTKVDESGHLMWARAFGGAGSEYPLAITVDAAGTVYITGTYDAPTDLDPSEAVSNTAAYGSTDIFISKLAADGTFLWGQGIGGPGVDAAHSVAHDANGSVYIGGRFTGEVDFGHALPGMVLAAAGGATDADGFILKLDLNGTALWAKRIGNAADDHVSDVAVDADGNIAFTGTFASDDADLDPAPDAYALFSPEGATDAFVAQWDAEGNYRWAQQLGGPDADAGLAIAVCANGDPYITGTFSGTCAFDPSGNTPAVTAAGSTDVFVTKCAADGAYLWTRTIGGTNTDAVMDITCAPEGHVWLGGLFSGSIDLDPGAGQRMRTSNGANDLFVLCLDPWGNYAADQVTGALLDDRVNGMNVGADFVRATGTFHGRIDMDPGADSTWVKASDEVGSAFTFVLAQCVPTKGELVDTGCEAYVWNGVTYTTSGTYQQHFDNTYGCDSVAVLSLTIAGIDTTVTELGGVLQAVQDSAMYQWVDCGHGDMPIGGATDASFTPEVSGQYAVVITVGGCVMRSSCHLVLSTDIQEVQRPVVTLSPNPAQGPCVLRSDVPLGDVRLTDVEGRLLASWRTNGTTLTVDVSGFSPGTYLVQGVGATPWVQRLVLGR
ncbi:MAG TPA: hypothetical protein VHL57_01305, partial [Flavobacteriales bacterium]|nr:hypothetical protein [Flavobacteriales bacterium]